MLVKDDMYDLAVWILNGFLIYVWAIFSLIEWIMLFFSFKINVSVPYLCDENSLQELYSDIWNLSEFWIG